MQRKVVREVGGEESGQREKQRRKVLLSGGRERRATEDAAVMENGQSHLPNHSQSRGAQLLPYGAEPGALSLGGPAQPPDSRPPMTTGLIRSEALGSSLSQVFVSSCGDLVVVPAAIIGFYFHSLWGLQKIV